MNAIGLTATQAEALQEIRGSMMKRIHAGFAARNGVLSTLLAQKGFTAASTVLEGERGYFRSHWKLPDLNRLTKDLGNRYMILQNGFKMYPCCSAISPAVDAALDLTRRREMSIEKITVRIGKFVGVGFFEPRKEKIRPTTVLSAQFSIPYCVAAAILDKDIHEKHFTRESLKDRRILTLAKKVKPIWDLKLDKLLPRFYPTVVEVVTNEGKKYSKKVKAAWGDPLNPPTQSQLEEKFRRLAKVTLTPVQIDKLIENISNLERIADLCEVMELEYN